MSRRQSKKSYRRRLIAALISRQGGVCWLCKRAMFESEITVDHIIPKARGGSGERENLMAAHGRCNSYRGDIAIEEFQSGLLEAN